MQNALMIDPHTGQPVEWSQARAPGLGIGGIDPQTIEMLRQAGLWTDDMGAAVPSDFGNDVAGRAGARQQWQGSDQYRQLQDALQGYTQGQSRQDYTLTDYLRDPSGNVVAQNSFQNAGDSLRTNDYLSMAAVVGGGLAAGSALGAAGVGTGATTGGLQGAIAQGALTGGAVGGGAGALGTAGQLGAGLGAVGGTAAATSGDPTRAALYGNEGYGAGTAATTGTSGGGGMGSSLADFFSGNGSLSDYMRAGSTLYGMYANDKATDAAVGGQNDANALMRQMYEQNRADNQPLLDMRNSTLPQIQNLLANPSSITSDPGYQFGLNQGQSQIDNQAAARGGYYSGAQLKASQRYGQDYASTKLNDSLNRLMGVAGLGQVGATANQSNNTNYSQMGGGGLAQQGNIRGSGYIGGANTLLNGANAWMQDNYWQQALKGGGG